MTGATSAWFFIGVFVAVPLILTLILVLAMGESVGLIAGLIVLFTFAGIGWVLGPGLLFDE